MSIFSHSTNLSTAYNPHGGADRVLLSYQGKSIGGLVVRPAPPAEGIKEFIEAGKDYYKEKSPSPEKLDTVLWV